MAKVSLDPVSIAGSVLGIIGGLFTSKKHYNLYYWEPADGTWKFVLEGHPSQLKPYAAQYAAQHIPTKLVRNKSGSAVTPTDPPAGYEAAKTPATMNYLMIAALVGIIGIAVYFLFIKRKRKK